MTNPLKSISDFISGIFKNFGLDEAKVDIPANYWRRLMENHYDKLAQTEFFQRLKQLDKNEKYAVEFFMYAVNTLFTQSVGKNTYLGKLVSEGLGDAMPEMAKRLINGSAGTAKTEEDERVRRFLLSMDYESLRKFLAMLKNTTVEERMEILKILNGLPVDDILKIFSLPADMVFDFIMLFKKSQPEKKANLFDRAKGDIEQGLTFFSEEMERRREKRKGGEK